MAGHGLQSVRLETLLAGEAAGDLSPAEITELGALLACRADVGREELMVAAALAQLSCLRTDPRGLARMPVHLEASLARQAASWSAEHPHGTATPPRPGGS
jgi:hypothetical protein